MNPIKHSLLFTLVLFSCCLASAQDGFSGRHYVSAGAGFPNLPKLYFNSFSNTLDNFKASGSGPFHMKYENRVSRWFGVGVSVNYMAYKITYTKNDFDTAQGNFKLNNITVSSRNTAVNLRGNIHFIDPQKLDKIDAYLGMGLGYKFGKPKVSSEVEGFVPSFSLPKVTNFGFELTMGFRYFIQEHIGFYAEIGAAKSIIQAGVTVRW